MYAVTTTGTTVKRFQKDVMSVTLGNSWGIGMLPSTSFMIAIPAVMTTKTTANATDRAEV